MALSASQVWEVRTTGSDQNGGAFKAGSSGTDYSVQDAAQIAVADAVANGTTTLTSATAAFSAAHVGNVLYLAGGSGSLAATRREVVAFTNSSTIVLDAAVATGGGITLNLGGAILTFVELASSTRGMAASNKAFVKSGTYGITAGVTFAQSVAIANFANLPTEIQGYKTVRGDISLGVNAAFRPVLQTNAAALNALTFSGAGLRLAGIVVGAGTSPPGNAVTTSGTAVTIHNCRVSAYANTAFYSPGSYNLIHACEVAGGVGSAVGGIYLTAGNCNVVGCYVHDGVGPGVYSAAADSNVLDSVIANQSGAAADGILGYNFNELLYNTIYNCGRHGISMSSLRHGITMIRGNILAKNGGYGLTNLAGPGLAARAAWDGNAYYSNTGGARNNLDDTTVNPANAVAPYANALDVLLASPNDPFTNAAGGDFTLNGMAGRGALLRGTGPSNAWPGIAQAGYRDFGAIQHQDAGGTTITTFIEG